MMSSSCALAGGVIRNGFKDAITIKIDIRRYLLIPTFLASIRDASRAARSSV
jgi:hypothetical protein